MSFGKVSGFLVLGGRWRERVKVQWGYDVSWEMRGAG